MKLRQLMGDDWFEYLKTYLKSNFFESLQEKLLAEINKKDGTILIPSLELAFEPLRNCPLKDLKVVILNDRPFFDLKANDGLAFSVSDENVGIMDIPLEAESFWEGIEKDEFEGFKLVKDYNYHKLAAQGVLLLNCSPTLSYKKVTERINSENNWTTHYDIWKSYIKYVIHKICSNNTGIIFITFGKKAREYVTPVLKSNNYLLTSSHPRNQLTVKWDSGGVFSTTNKILNLNNNSKINWL